MPSYVIKLLCLQLKQLSHRNLNEFVGAYISPPAVYICFAFCSKGSVWDVINRQSILLTWDFRLSLIVDIAKVFQRFVFSACWSVIHTLHTQTCALCCVSIY